MTLKNNFDFENEKDQNNRDYYQRLALKPEDLESIEKNTREELENSNPKPSEDEINEKITQKINAEIESKYKIKLSRGVDAEKLLEARNFLQDPDRRRVYNKSLSEGFVVVLHTDPSSMPESVNANDKTRHYQYFGSTDPKSFLTDAQRNYNDMFGAKRGNASVVTNSNAVAAFSEKKDNTLTLQFASESAFNEWSAHKFGLGMVSKESDFSKYPSISDNIALKKLPTPAELQTHLNANEEKSTNKSQLAQLDGLVEGAISEYNGSKSGFFSKLAQSSSRSRDIDVIRIILSRAENTTDAVSQLQTELNRIKASSPKSDLVKFVDKAIKAFDESNQLKEQNTIHPKNR